MWEAINMDDISSLGVGISCLKRVGRQVQYLWALPIRMSDLRHTAQLPNWKLDSDFGFSKSNVAKHCHNHAPSWRFNPTGRYEITYRCLILSCTYRITLFEHDFNGKFCRKK